MLAVVSSTCLTDNDMKLRSLIVQYLQEIFVEIFPGCVVTSFGSTSTGLGLRRADIDLCLLAEHELLKSALDQEGSSSCSSDLTEQAQELIVNILRRFAAGFQNVVSVRAAKCPVVKFVHRDSGLSCDLSINNRYSEKKSCMNACTMNINMLICFVGTSRIFSFSYIFAYFMFAR